MTVPFEVQDYLIKQAEIGAHDAFRGSVVRGLDKSIQGLEYNRENSPWHYALNPAVGGPIAEVIHRLTRRIHGSGTVGSVASSIPYVNSVAAPIAAMMGSDTNKQETVDAVNADAEYEDFDQQDVRGREESKSKKKDKPEDDDAKEDKSKESAYRQLGHIAKSAELGPWDVQRGSSMSALDELIQGDSYNREHNPGNYYLNPLVPGPLSEGFHRALRGAYGLLGSKSQTDTTDELANDEEYANYDQEAERVEAQQRVAARKEEKRLLIESLLAGKSASLSPVLANQFLNRN